MKTEFELSNANIPYGVLHDQILSDLKYENGELFLLSILKFLKMIIPTKVYMKNLKTSKNVK